MNAEKRKSEAKAKPSAKKKAKAKAGATPSAPPAGFAKEEPAQEEPGAWGEWGQHDAEWDQWQS